MDEEPVLMIELSMERKVQIVGLQLPRIELFQVEASLLPHGQIKEPVYKEKGRD